MVSTHTRRKKIYEKKTRFVNTRNTHEKKEKATMLVLKKTNNKKLKEEEKIDQDK